MSSEPILAESGLSNAGLGHAASFILSAALACMANIQIQTLMPDLTHLSFSSPSLLLLLLPNPMLKQLCPVCESSTGSVRVIDDAVSAGNMF